VGWCLEVVKQQHKLVVLLVTIAEDIAYVYLIFLSVYSDYAVAFIVRVIVCASETT